MKKTKMTTRMLVWALLLVLTLLPAGCGNDGGSNQSDTGKAFTGKFSGPAGTLEFLPDNQVKVDLEDDAVWMINYEENNHKTHQYKFITNRNEVVAYDKAQAINYYKPEKEQFFMQNSIKVEKDKVILYPGLNKEVVFNKESE